MRKGLQFRYEMERVAATNNQIYNALNHADLMILGLLFQQNFFDHITVESKGLADTLRSALKLCRFRQDVQLTSDSKGSQPSLWLIELPQLRHLAPRLDRSGPILIYGMVGFCPLDSFSSDLADFAIMPLSSQAPALWHSGLVWLASGEAAPGCTAATQFLTEFLKDSEIDAFALFERIQRLEAGPRDTAPKQVEADAVDEDRIEELESALAALRHSKLLQHHLLIAEVAQRLKIDK